MTGKNKIRVVLMGSPEFAVPVLVALLGQRERYELVGVVTQPDKKAGRGRQLTPCAVKQRALEYGLPVMTPSKLKNPETVAELQAFSADLFVVVAYGRLLPDVWLSMPSRDF